MKAFRIRTLWFISCLLCISAYGQEAKNNKKDIFTDGYIYEWCIWKRYDDGRTQKHNITKNQDKVFNGLTYHSANITLYQKCYWRYEDNKLYRYNEAEGTEYVLLDFGLSVGDVFEMRDGRKMRVSEVIDTLFRSRYEEGYEYGTYRLLKVFNVNDEADCDEWLEGFGSMSTSILSDEEMGEGVCESHVLWTSDFPILNIFGTDYLKTQLMTEEDTGIDLIPDSMHCEFAGDTLVVSGNIFTPCAMEHYLMCDVQNDIILFSVSPVTMATCTGVFWFTARFPGFKEGIYTFRYTGMNRNKIEKEVICGNPNHIQRNSHPLSEVSDCILPSGQKISADTPSKGIRIIRYSDGTVKKVYSK